jgi:hypothetical protein
MAFDGMLVRMDRMSGFYGRGFDRFFVWLELRGGFVLSPPLASKTENGLGVGAEDFLAMFFRNDGLDQSAVGRHWSERPIIMIQVHAV